MGPVSQGVRHRLSFLTNQEGPYAWSGLDHTDIKVSFGALDGPYQGLAKTQITGFIWFTDPQDPTKLISPIYTSEASIRIDEADVPDTLRWSWIYTVALHEISHAMGFGHLWEANNLVVRDADGRLQYTGEAARNMYWQEFSFRGAAPPELAIEQSTDGISFARHWDKSGGQPPGGLLDPIGRPISGIQDPFGRDFSFELMASYFTSSLDGPGPFDYWVSRTTLAAFEDLGYFVTPTAPIPEPQTWTMLLAGLGMIAAIARKRASSNRLPTVAASCPSNL
jgi:hypothetical protein